MELVHTFFGVVKVIVPTTHQDDRGTFTEYLNPLMLEL